MGRDEALEAADPEWVLTRREGRGRRRPLLGGPLGGRGRSDGTQRDLERYGDDRLDELRHLRDR